MVYMMNENEYKAVPMTTFEFTEWVTETWNKCLEEAWAEEKKA